ncbi:hypothetical protein [uncultured Nocardioides sp.]|uniref:Uncharacterized protein n=1 Tax=uncultured Nocardioides sp. TaxID=198441 RepID=A0A6J4NV67_9ACTN|nr:hypothetical protein [uncultured Nocardioides sp.]CAA9394694.1 MAG: hypothetical protein AVDCRST_MAG06-1827 [uncultured Nocardioides sp.]
MHESASEVELVARNRIRERVAGSPTLVRTARPRRRTTVARTLRRVADRLDG